MKYTITHIVEWVLLGIIIILFCYTAYKSYQVKQKVEYITTTDTVKICDTITNMDYDTIYFSHFDTVQLPAIVINDTLLKIDSIFVQIPIETTVYDTVIKDTAHITHLRAQISGFGTTLDTLTIDTEIMPQKAILPRKKWYDNFGVGLGLGVTYKDGFLVGPMVGIMYNF
jgi:hypothetical protein